MINSKRLFSFIIKQQSENLLKNNIYQSKRLFSTNSNNNNNDNITIEETIENKKSLLKKKNRDQKNLNKLLSNDNNELDSIINENRNKELLFSTTKAAAAAAPTPTTNNKKSTTTTLKDEIKTSEYIIKKEISPGIFINPELTKADKRNVVITCAKDKEEEAIELSKKLNLDFLPLQQVLKLPNEIFQYQSVLFVQERGVSLHDFEPNGNNKFVRKMANEIFLDYTKGAVAFRAEFGKNKKSPMIRSICVSASGSVLPTTVLDVTGGLGKDAWIMASMGVNVTIVERNPVLIYMIERALSQALLNPDTSEIASRITLIHMDSIQYIVENINTMPEEKRPMVIYMDPMYPTKKKEKSLSKKDIRAVRKLVGGDRDSTILFALSRRFAQNRVVWKRPREIIPFIGSNIEYKSSDTQFYVYFTKDHIKKEKDLLKKKEQQDDIDEDLEEDK